MKMVCAAAAAAMVLALGTTARAQSHAAYRPAFAPAGNGAAAVQKLTPEQRQERRFLQEVAGNLRFQAEASRLALARSADPRVRQVAAALVNHAAATQPEVLHLLHQRGMALPLRGNDEVRVIRALAAASGPKFDRVYLDEVALKTNTNDAARFERVLAVSRDPQLQAWAQRHLSTVRYHVVLAGGRPASTATMGAPRAVMLSGPGSP
ncbi:DUF4142 domain-containing protein [Ramlibacter sp.]|uniref:DUF4142 domain-containing protein n=1 Tax=Ramlibacter sp. TaxID=1917967 RepID=UPI003D1002BC